LADLGTTAFVEVGPGGSLTAMIEAALPDDRAALAVATLRKDRTESASLLTAVAAVHTRGVDVAWQAVLADRGARRVDLPTYPFQHDRYWMTRKTGDPADLGLTGARHPLVGAAVELPEVHGWVFTGHLSTGTQPWLAQHGVL